MNLTELTLYNNYHNGDVFYSRVIVRQLLKRYNIKFHHNNAKNLFEDLLNVTETIIPNLNTAKRSVGLSKIEPRTKTHLHFKLKVSNNA
jgi:hypothetical protein